MSIFGQETGRYVGSRVQPGVIQKGHALAQHRNRQRDLLRALYDALHVFDELTLRHEAIGECLEDLQHRKEAQELGILRAPRQGGVQHLRGGTGGAVQAIRGGGKAGERQEGSHREAHADANQQQEDEELAVAVALPVALKATATAATNCPTTAGEVDHHEPRAMQDVVA